ncbi:conserved hypothetical protein [Desulfamplus magnetovallimortis]|uniref:PilZ domain-containing protein n=1 Tax=Desulfamplus magnetovallimortis TaxID=1246637 RepID=A0A1W1H9W0_9BACT|nr:PilZ domain-containing protein [Desulfamplus magnetovallimortis]SLM29270.1 conserved hypothetical protein [Desulfamplus magnetovallimortis]
MAEVVNKGRRNHPRVDFQTKISLLFSENERDVTGASKNLSMKGLFVETMETVSPGEKCKVKIELSGVVGGLTLLINARVARVEAHGMGIVFDTMDLESYTHLRNIVQYNSVTAES